MIKGEIMYAEEIFYTEKGEGTPLILLHGNGEDSSIFDKFGEKLSKKYRVIAEKKAFK